LSCEIRRVLRARMNSHMVWSFGRSICSPHHHPNVCPQSHLRLDSCRNSSNISESVEVRDWRQQSPIRSWPATGRAVRRQQYGTVRKRGNDGEITVIFRLSASCRCALSANKAEVVRSESLLLFLSVRHGANTVPDKVLLEEEHAV
jgi:hypothetical protein